jgi:hypothetical protein
VIIAGCFLLLLRSFLKCYHLREVFPVRHIFYIILSFFYSWQSLASNLVLFIYLFIYCSFPSTRCILQKSRFYVYLIYCCILCLACGWHLLIGWIDGWMNDRWMDRYGWIKEKRSRLMEWQMDTWTYSMAWIQYSI